MPTKPKAGKAASTGKTDVSGEHAAVDLSRGDGDKPAASTAAVSNGTEPQGMVIDGLDEAQLKQEASAPVALDGSVEETQAPSTSDAPVQPTQFGVEPRREPDAPRGSAQAPAVGGGAAEQEASMPGDSDAIAEAVRVDVHNVD